MSMMMMAESFKKKVGNPARKLVLLKLADNANDQGECWPSYGHIASECEMGKSTVIAHLKKLAEDGYLIIQERKNGVRNSSNMYKLTLDQGKEINRCKPNRPGKKAKDVSAAVTYQPLIGDVSTADTGISTADRGVYQPLTPEPISMNQSVNQSVNPSCATALHEGFEIFYCAGLPKKNRKKAESAFKTQSKKHGEPVAFGKMLAENIKGRLGTGELGFDDMHPSTYLNQQRWLDEVPTGSDDSCPHHELIDLWAEVMPEFRQHAKNIWAGSKREKDLAARWKAGFNIKHERTGEPLYTDKASGLDWWGRFFRYLRKSQFLMTGQNWLSLEWVSDRENFDSIIEKKYHDGGES